MATDVWGYFGSNHQNLCKLAQPLLEYNYPQGHPLAIFCVQTLEYSSLHNLRKSFQSARKAIQGHSSIIYQIRKISAFMLNLFDTFHFIRGMGYKQVPVVDKTFYKTFEYSSDIANIYKCSVSGKKADSVKVLGIYAKFLKNWVADPRAKLCFALLGVAIECKASIMSKNSVLAN